MEVDEELDAELEVRDGREEAPSWAVGMGLGIFDGDLTTSKALGVSTLALLSEMVCWSSMSISLTLTKSSAMKLSSKEA